MDGSSWYQQQQQANAYANQSSPTQAATSSTSHSNSLSDFQEAQRVLNSYPFASATPASSHVTRHLDNLTMTAPVPSYIHPQYYSHHVQSNPSYTEYTNLAAPTMPPPGPHLEYWEQSRDEAVRLLVPESAGHYLPVQQQQWSPASYGTPPFAAAVMHRTLPYISSSSSSLALALGDPSKPSTSSVAPRPQPEYQPQESAQFFDEFITETSQQAVAQEVAATPPPPVIPDQSFTSDIKTPMKETVPALEPSASSPDPLAGSAGDSTTPRKRRPEELSTPTPKRVHSPLKSRVQRGWTGSSQSSLCAGATHMGSQPNKRLSVFVEVPVPHKGWSTPSTAGRTISKSAPSTRASDDLGGFSPPPESDWEEDLLGFRSGSKSTGKRTGDRDERAPLEKLTAFIEEIFEAEDSLQPDAELDELPKDWFSIHTVDATRPLLAEGIIRKLTKLTSQIARPRKRMRLARDTPRKPGAGTLSEMETVMLSRLLKILERSVKVGEDVDPFGASERKGSPAKTAGKTTAGAKKSKVGGITKAKSKEPARGRDSVDVSGRVRSRSRSPMVEDHPEGGNNTIDGNGLEGVLTEQDFQKLEKLLEAAKESVLAADSCIALLAADKLPKQLYSEELITACFATIKNQLTKVIYPFVEATSDVHGHSTPLLLHVAKSGDYSSQIYRREIGETFQALTAVLPRVNALVGSEVAMSDTIVIQAVYIAIGPFFVVETGMDVKSKKDSGNSLVLGSLGGKGAMRALRLEALSLIRSIFANHEDQRSWIIEEILTSLIKLPDLKQKSGQFRLRDGRTIHTVSALLLQLVQTSAHDVRLKVKRLAINRQQSFVMRHDSQMDGSTEAFLTDRDHEEIQLYAAGLDSASKAAKTIVLFLTQRSGKGKATKSSNEAEYRAIFDNLISDLLTVLYWPEWPAAALLLRIICRFMVSSLSDKTNNNTDNNAAKTVALDHLGVIAARLTTSSLKFRNALNRENVKSLDEILANADRAQLTRLISIHQEVSNHLAKRSSEDQACDSARELTAVGWGHELTNALTHCNSILQRMETEGESSDHQAFRKLADGVKSALCNVWQEAVHDVFDIGSEEDAARVDLLAEELGTTQSLGNAFDAILNVILVSLDATAVFMRTKALRALGLIVTADPSILRNVNVRKAIETHLLDSSPQVRDAAVELIGKYVVTIPEVAGEYYEQIADRIADTGLAVRKRVIKLLRTFHSVSSQNERRVDICTKLVLRMNDEDDSVKDLAMKIIEEIWFGELQDAPPRVNVRSNSSPLHEKSQLLGKVSVIMGVSSQFRDRQSPLEELLHKVIMDKDGKDSQAIHDRYAEIGNTLIDCLVDAQELPGFTVVNCIKTIYLFASAHPPIISTQQTTTLLPYLKNATTAEEQITSDYLLKIFRVAIPGMPKTASKFAHELQSVLQQMLMKPTGPNWVATLQEIVACICSVVRHLTHDFHLLVALLKSCNARLREHLARPKNHDLDVNTKKKLNLQVFIASLLCEHCDFDKLRVENAASASDLASISQGSLTEHIYGVMLQMYEKFGDPMIRARLLDCLGFLFRAYPTLMTLETSATIMDAIFISPDEEARGRLLKIMQDFLITESTKQSAQEKAAHKTKNTQTRVNMEELVGNTDGFADSGVSSAIVQRYLPQILEAAMTRNIQMQAAAVDILGFTVRQGLAHPLQCLPVIVALETSSNPNLSNRTGALHTILYNKHHSLMNSRHLECARASFLYQRKVTAGAVRGFRLNPTPTALLHRWYTLVREKRASRQDFLKTITKAFDLDSTNLSSTQDDIDFVRYMAENVSAFDYKTQEEVLTVIRHLTSVLSVVGMALVETMAPTTLREPACETHMTTSNQNGLTPAHYHGPLPKQQPVSVNNATGQSQDLKPAAQKFDAMNLARCSVAVGIILLLKSHLKLLYGLTEDKCSKWVPGKKSAMGDKPAIKRREVPLVWERMIYATQPVRTEEDAVVQQTKFLELWAEDPVTVEPEDDPME